MTNHHYLKNTLWQKINQKRQICQQALMALRIEQKEANQSFHHLRQELTAWDGYWQREQQITELETDAHHCQEAWKRRLIFQQMKELILINKQLKKDLKKLNYE